MEKWLLRGRIALLLGKSWPPSNTLQTAIRFLSAQSGYALNFAGSAEIIAAAYDKAGFDEVILTPRSGDYGRDVIAIKYGFGSVKFIDQVKAYNPGHIVTAEEVRALLGVLQAEQDATKVIFTTTSTFAPRIKDDKFIKPFLPFRLELVNKEKLLERLASTLKTIGSQC
jgi:hypothetical protein